MTDANKLQALAEIIKTRNRIDDSISEIIGRPALPGHFGEFVAAEIFDITLHESATHRGSDGYFADGKLEGKSVNIKFYPKNEGLLDITLKSPPDFYLVLAGPRVAAEPSRGTTRPWKITSAFLFNHAELVSDLKSRGVKLGTATSVRRQYWDEAEIYPAPTNPNISLSPLQKRMLQLFNS